MSVVSLFAFSGRAVCDSFRLQQSKSQEVLFLKLAQPVKSHIPIMPFIWSGNWLAFDYLGGQETEEVLQ